MFPRVAHCPHEGWGVTGEEFIVMGVTAQQAHKCKLREDRSVRTGVVREDSGRGATRMSTFIVSKW